ncbi:MAG: 50S ribosomal protein L21 [Planctomycetes bacterium]|nr:50S ribosomal protein L21 [Planctomycetota bacterium]
MYAVIEDSGRQFRVSEGDVVDVDLRELDENATEVTFDRVLLVSDEDEAKIGTPLVDGASVTAEIVDKEAKGPKLHVQKWRRRKASRRKTGHRQKYLRLRIASISS